ncbi:thioesterase-like superfamily-domain-containing protein [Biscogniauxia mediterranea]|nr:thioesterase-like superfamily-domain-containing protein [Biscogniauxia mediterranea]
MAPPTFAEATAIVAKDSHTYEVVNFPPEWCIGSVPHGGVVTSALLRVAALHFATTLSSARQPHTIIAHVEFLRRTQAGRALVSVRDVKVGRQTSTVHLSLSQGGDDLVVAYVTNGTDLSLGSGDGGVSLETGWALHPPPAAPAPADFARLAARGGDAHWAELRDRPFAEFRGAMGRLRMFVPRGARAGPARRSHVVEEWVRFASGERFTNESVGFVSDAWPQLLEGWGADPPAAVEGGKGEKGEKEKEQRQEDGKAVRERQRKAWHWYPTLVLNLDVKKALPPEGVEWLFVRLHAKQVKNGRLDYEIVIMDQAGDIVALSHHVVMVVDGERNLAKRRGTGESKI